MSVRVAVDRHENAGVLAYLRRGRGSHAAPLSQSPEEVDYGHLGTHPDVLERLWTEINSALPADGRCVVYGGPALVQPQSGVVLALGLGTSYTLRLPLAERDLALMSGAAVVHTYRTVGVTLDLETTFGWDWVFGGWNPREPDWLAASYRLMGS